MSEADRVFARMVPSEPHPAPEDRQYLHIAPRKRGPDAGQGRVVEVIHRRSDRSAEAPREGSRSGRSSAHAETWPDGFQARSAPMPPAAEPPAAAPEPAPVVHVMPGWEPLLPPVEAQAPPAVVPAAAAPPPRKAEPKAPRGRAFADPYASEDTGANCMRCGYLVEPAREKRGLMTCASCG